MLSVFGSLRVSDNESGTYDSILFSFNLGIISDFSQM